MKQISKSTHKVLNMLRSAGSPLSGQYIADELGISRTSIWKHINELRDLGFDISAAKNVGYKIESVPDTLNSWDIDPYLKTKSLGREYYYYGNISSTMDEASRKAIDGASHGTVVLAESQEAGRGRLRREWVSTKDNGLYFSLILRPSVSLAEVSKLTLVAGAAVATAIKAETNINLSLKWPNDILVGDKKLCGILTELNAESDGVNFVIVGIGINVNNSQKDLIDAATSVFEQSNKKSLRAKILAAVLNEFECLYEDFLNMGFSSIQPVWHAFSSMWGERVKISTANDEFEAIAYDLAEDGTFLVQCDDGTIKSIMTGDITRLRLQK